MKELVYVRIDKETKALIYSSLFRLDDYCEKQIEKYLSDDIDWGKFWKLVGIYKLYGMLYYHIFIRNNISSSLIPSVYKDQLKQLYMRCIARNRVMFEEIRNIAEEMEYAGIKMLFLKGPIAISRLYNNDIGLRGFSDLDVVLQEEDVGKGREILERLDYKRECEISPESAIYSPDEWLKRPHEEPMMKRGNSIFVPSYTIEMHRSRPYYGLNVDKMINNSVKEKCDNIDLWALSRTDEAIFLLTHAYQHILAIYMRRAMPLQMFAEIREVLSFIWKTEGLDAFIKRVIEVNAKTPVYVSLVYINYIYENFVPARCLEAVKPEKSSKNQLKGKEGCGVFNPSTFNEMLMLDKIEDIALWNERLNSVPFGELVTMGALDISPLTLKARMLGEIQDERWDKHEITVVRVAGINGNLSGIDWTSIYGVALPEANAADHHFFGSNVRRGINPRKSLGMIFKFVWDDTHLYLNAKVNDDISIFREGKVGDGITLNFDKGDSLFHCGLFPNPEGNAQIFKFLNEEWTHVRESEILANCMIYNNEGYSMEAAIPWSDIGIKPEDNQKIGFDIELVDFTEDVASPEYILVWSGGKGLGWRANEVWGSIVLKGYGNNYAY